MKAGRMKLMRATRESPPAAAQRGEPIGSAVAHTPLDAGRSRRAGARGTIPHAGHAADRWLPAWHGLFYACLLLCAALALGLDGHSQRQGAIIALLTAAQGAWYGVCMAVGARFQQRRPLLALAYLGLGWALWLLLVGLDPAYLFLLGALYPQLFLFVAMPWAVVDALLLTFLWTGRQAALSGRLSGPLLLLTLGVGGCAVMLALFINAVIRQSVERGRLLAELEATRHDLAAAERQAGILEERQRLAGEIHDTLAQGFSLVVMHLEAAEAAAPGNVRAGHLDQARRTARESLTEARRFMWGLQPTALDHGSLREALTALAARWSQEAGIGAELTVTGTPRPLRPECEVTLLRAAQEALANARKHARARAVALTLSYIGDVAALDVHDDGGGLDPAQLAIPCPTRESNGFGLRALRERVERLGGTLTVESAPGEGTTVAVALPLSGVVAGETP